MFEIAMDSVHKRGVAIPFQLVVITGGPAITLPSPDPYHVRRVVEGQEPKFIFQPQSQEQDTVVAPGNSRDWRWDQKDSGGKQVDTGKYRLFIAVKDRALTSKDFDIVASGWRKVGEYARTAGKYSGIVAVGQGIRWLGEKVLEHAPDLLMSLPPLQVGVSSMLLALDPPDPNYKERVQMGDVLQSWLRLPGTEDFLSKAPMPIGDYFQISARLVDFNIALWRTMEKIEGAALDNSDEHLRAQCSHMQALCSDVKGVVTAFQTVSQRLCLLAEKPDDRLTRDELVDGLARIMAMHREQIYRDVPVESEDQRRLLDRAIEALAESVPEGGLNFREVTDEVVRSVEFYGDNLEMISRMHPEEFLAEVTESSSPT